MDYLRLLQAEIVPGIPDAVFGPFGVLVLMALLLTFAARLLWIFIKDLMSQRDLSLVGWREQTAATLKVAEAVEERNRAEAEELRIEAAVAVAEANQPKPKPARTLRGRQG